MKTFAVLFFALLSVCSAQGFTSTPGGRGGKIIRVTTLAPNGSGSFAAALGAKGPRIVVFEVGGVIDLAGKSLALREPFVTIAGQTAPAPGITLIKGTLNIMTHDVIIQHLSVRPGEAGRAKKSGWEADGISGVGASNVIVDHCSCTWAIDENLTASGERFGGGDSVEDWRAKTSHHVTFSNCLIAEALSNSTHGKGEHSKGSLLHDNTTFLTVVGNLYASNTERNPLAKGGVHAVIVNNWISNPGRRAIHHALVASEWGKHSPVTSRLAIVGNVLEHGANTPPKMPLFANHYDSPLELFMEDNLAFDREHRPAPLLEPSVSPQQIKPPWPDGLVPMPAEKVKEFIAKNVGARPWDRDPIDARIVKAALDGTGKIIDSELEAGGYPDRPATRAPFQPEEWNLDTMQPFRQPR